MKTYSSGADNVTRQPIKSNIPGYQSLLDLGFSNQGTAEQDSNWNRFWIVPAEVNRQQSTGKELTLFDIPLKVNAEHMVMKNGQLETAPDGTPSPEAKTFSEWFTANYQKLSAEVRSLPPRESGFNEPVAVFTELRRVALITGIAETLRDQGVPLPFWMLDYQVKPCPVPTNTPAITVEKSDTQTNQMAVAGGIQIETSSLVQQIYGGVDLSVPDQNIHTIRPSPEADSLFQSLPSPSWPCSP